MRPEASSLHLTSSWSVCPRCQRLQASRVTVITHKSAVHRAVTVVALARNAKRLKYSQGAASGPGRGEPLFVQCEADGSDSWRLDPVIALLEKGGVSMPPPLAVRSLQTMCLHCLQPDHRNLATTTEVRCVCLPYAATKSHGCNI